jgi:mono/diheme cytochrome c family protein
LWAFRSDNLHSCDFRMILDGYVVRDISIVIALSLLLLACTEQRKADPANAEQVAYGKRIYEAQCASCHGAKLEGQPNWRERLPSGKFPAPPHDASGHTWHHSDALLFDIVKRGIQAHAPPGYQSDMPAFGSGLSDEDIWAVLAYIKSTWPEETRKWQAAVSAEDARVRR